MGSRHSKPDIATDQAAGYGTAQLLRDDDPLSSYSLTPPKLSPVASVVPFSESLYHRPSTLFPSELPERPPKNSRLNLRKGKPSLKSLPLASSSQSFPVSPPLSPLSVRLDGLRPEGQLQASSPFSTVQSGITPPTSPTSPANSKSKVFRFDAVSQNLRSTVSSPSLSASSSDRRLALPVARRSPFSRSLGGVQETKKTAREGSSGVLHRREDLSPDLPLDLPQQRLARLSLAPSGPSTREQQLSHVGSFSGTPRQTFYDVLSHPAGETSTMGLFSAAHRPAVRSSVSQLHRRSNRKLMRQTPDPPPARFLHRHQYGGALDRNLAASFEELPRTPQDRTGGRVVTYGNSAAGRTLARQEDLDWELALQLQQEDNDAMDIYSPYAERRSISEPPSSSASDDDLYTNLWRSQTTGNPNSRFANHRNSYSDSIDLDVDDDHYNPDAELARQLTNGLPDYDVGLGHSLPNYDRVIQENVDKEIARQLQQEEEDRRRQENARPSTRDCAVCGEATPIPDFPALVDCSHRPQTCVDCYQGWIASELSNNQWNKIKCPEHKCRVILKHHEVQQYATAEVYAKFDTLSARSVLNDEPNFRWCRARDCQSGQIHISGEEGNIFRCVACGFRVCIIHEDTWHEGETCEEYDYRKCGRKERDQKKQEEASVKAIEELTKRCPGHGCKWNIEKNEGCDHMTCSKCRHEFCWICLAPYNRIRKKGNSAHNQDCKYHTNRIS